MIEISGANPQEHGVSDGIPVGEIAKRISSIEEPRGRVEATRLSLQYLLAKRRPLDSLFLLEQIDAKNLPFNPGERDKMFNGILRTANDLLEEDPIQAWDTIWNITYAKAKRAPTGESKDFTREEYERLNTQEFKNQQAATLARYIECYLNPDIEIKGRGRFAREDLSSHMNNTTSNMYDLDFDKIFDSLDKATREKLLAVAGDHPLSVFKSRLQKLQEAGKDTTKGKVSEARGEAGENGEIVSVTDEMITWRDGNREVNIRKYNGDEMWMVFYNDGNSKFPDSTHGLLVDNFDLADIIKGLKDRDFQDIEPDTAEKIYQALATSFLDPNDKSISSVLSKYLPVDMYMLYSAYDRRRFILKPDGTLGNPDNNESYTRNNLENPDMFEPRFAGRLKSAVGKAVLETWIKNSPAPTAPETDAAHKPVIGEVAIRTREDVMRMLGVDEKTPDSIFSQQGEGHFRFFLEGDIPNYIDIPEGMEVYFSIKPEPNAVGYKAVSIIGGKTISGEGARLNIKDLYSLGIISSWPPFIGIFTTQYKDWEERAEQGLKIGLKGQAVIYNSDAPYLEPAVPKEGLWMITEELPDFLKKRKEEIEKIQRAGKIVNPPGPPEEVTAGEKIISMEYISSAGLRADLNRHLKQNLSESHLSFSFSPDQLKEHITSMMGSGVKTGDITVDESGREITIHNFQIGKTLLVGGDKFNVTIGNREDGNGIEATWPGYRIGLFAGKTSERFQHLLNDIDFAVKENLNKDINENNASWKTKTIRIEDGKIRVEFEKLSEGERAKPSAAPETLESRAPVQEPKAKVEVTPISGEDFDYNRLVKLKIEGKESQIIWKQNEYYGYETGKGVFDLTELRQTRGKLMLPNGTRLRIGKYIIAESRSVSVTITGGTSTGISIRDLIYFKDRGVNIDLETNNGGNWSEQYELLNEKSGKAILNDYNISLGKEGEKITHGLSVEKAVALLKQSLEQAKT